MPARFRFRLGHLILSGSICPEALDCGLGIFAMVTINLNRNIYSTGRQDRALRRCIADRIG
jgi:hypothetical protein